MCQKFYYCRNNILIIISCPPKLLFDENTQKCTYSFKTTCYEDLTTLATKTTTVIRN